MKIIFLNGGLANQVFQYIFYRWAEIYNPSEEWYLDDSFFFVHNVHNGYELEKVFGLHPKLLSEYFDPDVWKYMISLKKEQNKSIPQILLDNGTDIIMVAGLKNWEQWNPFNGERIDIKEYYDDGLIRIPGAVYYHGYWIDKTFFQMTEDIIRQELVFPEINEPKNKEYMDEITSSESCSMHVRRGDFVTIGEALPNEAYRRAVMRLLSIAPDATVFVFSDDLEYCKEHGEEMGLDLPRRVVYVEGNHGSKAFRDMQLMSNCRYMMTMGKSSFTFLSRLLNKNARAYIDASC